MDNQPPYEEPGNTAPTPQPASSPRSRFSFAPRKVAIAAGLLVAAYLLYSILHLWISPDKNIQQVYLVPSDATFIIQSSDPVKDWQKFSDSPTWGCLKNARSFAEITRHIEQLDSVVKNNKTLLSLVGKRDLLISLHRTRPADWDFLAILDLQKVSKINMLKDQLENIMALAGNTVTRRDCQNTTIFEMRDKETRDILYIAFVGNHLVASYTSQLVEAAINSKNNPVIGLNPAFIEAEKLVAGKGLMRLFVNYAELPRFMSIYLGGSNEYIDLFGNSMEFAGLYFNTDKNKMEVKGYTLPKDTADPYITALFNSGKHKMKAHEIMSARTALYTNIGFNNPATFLQELDNTLSTNNKELHQSYINARKRIESLFGISLDEHFLSWMSGEFALSQSEAGLLGREPELILAIRAKNIKDARKNMEFIEKKVKNRTPIKIKSVAYKEYDINYIEMKGFFRLFFGNLFDKFEKPYYSYVDDYVVFSNQSASLLSFIEDYEQKNLLKDMPGFKNALSYHSSNSTLFLYADIHKFYPQLQRMLNASTWNEIKNNKEVLYSFPFWSMQFVGDKQQASLHYIMDYAPFEPEVLTTESSETADEEDKEMDETAESEKELMNELKRFYVEKFQGSILRDFYPDGKLKSETETKDGKRHGRYREYYEDGTLKTRGKYKNNRLKGTWKYYTPEGKFDRKEKF